MLATHLKARQGDRGAIGLAEQNAALEVARALLPDGAKVVLMGDRFYSSPDLIAWRAQAGWDWRLRPKADFPKPVPIGRRFVDADLGAGLIKQRVGRPGQGRRGGFRTLLAYRAGSRVVFLLGFAKNERDNIDADELAVLRARAQAFLDLGDAAIKARIADDDITEERCGAGEEQE